MKKMFFQIQKKRIFLITAIFSVAILSISSVSAASASAETAHEKDPSICDSVSHHCFLQIGGVFEDAGLEHGQSSVFHKNCINVNVKLFIDHVNNLNAGRGFAISLEVPEVLSVRESILMSAETDSEKGFGGSGTVQELIGSPPI